MDYSGVKWRIDSLILNPHDELKEKESDSRFESLSVSTVYTPPSQITNEKEMSIKSCTKII